MAAGAVHHPVFARLCAAMSYRMSPELTEHRRQLLARLSGRVLELGAGDGINFPLYPPQVSEVIAVEPES